METESARFALFPHACGFAKRERLCRWVLVSKDAFLHKHAPSWEEGTAVGKRVKNQHFA